MSYREGLRELIDTCWDVNPEVRALIEKNNAN